MVGALAYGAGLLETEREVSAAELVDGFELARLSRQPGTWR